MTTAMKTNSVDTQVSFCRRKLRFIWSATKRTWQNHTHRGIILLAIMCILFLYMMSLDEAYPYDSSEFMTPHHTEEERRDPKLPPDTEPPLNIYNIAKPYDADFKCVKTRTKPRTSVCLYPIWRDKYISHDLDSTGVWEPQVLRDFQEVLSRDTDLGVLDIGANVGFYTMLSAQMGHRVVAVEPFVESCYRIHRSVQIEQLQGKIVLLNNAVADKRITATVRGSGDNQGDTRIEMNAMPCLGSCPPLVKTILLDDLIHVTNMSRAMIKLDIQGYEHRAFQHASKLLDKIHIPYIFMEWLIMKSHHLPANQTSTDKLLVEEMMRLLFQSDYRPYALSADGGRPLDPRDWGHWPDDVVWHKLLNEDEQEQVIINHFRNWPP